jgi:hypothetical protein
MKTKNGVVIRTVIHLTDDKEEQKEKLEELRRQKKKVYDRVRYLKSREIYKARSKQWRKDNKDRERERKRIWSQQNRERLNAYFRRYYEMRPERREYLRLKSQEYRDRDRDLRRAS